MVEDFKETVFSQITEQLHTGTHGSDDDVHKIGAHSSHTKSQHGAGRATEPRPELGRRSIGWLLRGEESGFLTGVFSGILTTLWGRPHNQ